MMPNNKFGLVDLSQTELRKHPRHAEALNDIDESVRRRRVALTATLVRVGGLVLVVAIVLVAALT